MKLIAMCLLAAPAALGQVGLDGQDEILCAENLIINGGFEEGEGDWRASRGAVTIDTDTVYNGRASLRLDAPVSPETQMVHPPRMAVEPGVTYRLHFFHKSEAAHVGPLWRVYPIEPGRRMTRGRALWETCDGATDWAGYFRDYIFPSDVEQVEIIFAGGTWNEALDRDGTYWIDDVEFGPADEIDYGALSQVGDASLITNGGFESGYEGEAFGWLITQAIEGGSGRFGPTGASLHVMESEVAWDTDSYEGERCIRVSYTGDDQHHVRVGQLLFPEEGVEYDLRFWAKSEGQAGRVNMAAFGRDGRTPGLAGQVFVRDGEWTEYVLRYTPDENTPIPCGLRLGVAQVGRGTLWVDEIEMVPAE